VKFLSTGTGSATSQNRGAEATISFPILAE
jgi:hypothetical protein